MLKYNKYWTLLCIFLFCCDPPNTQENDDKSFLYSDKNLNQSALDFSKDPLNNQYYEITSKVDSVLNRYIPKNKVPLMCDNQYHHSRIDSTYLFLICLAEYETKLIITNNEKNDFNIIALQGGDGNDFWEVKSNYIDKNTLKKVSIEGYYTSTDPDTMYIRKKVISQVELKTTGKITETFIDSTFNVIEVLE